MTAYNSSAEEMKRHRDKLELCGLHLIDKSPRKSIWSPAVGFFAIVISPLLPNTLATIGLGSFLVLWGLLLRPRFFHSSSEHFFIYSLVNQFYSHERLLNYYVRYSKKIIGALDDQHSLHKLMDGRLYLAWRFLSDKFLLDTSPCDLARKTSSANIEVAREAAKLIGIIYLLNTIISLEHAIRYSKNTLVWPKPYEETLINLLSQSDTPRILLVQLLGCCYPYLYQLEAKEFTL